MIRQKFPKTVIDNASLIGILVYMPVDSGSFSKVGWASAHHEVDRGLFAGGLKPTLQKSSFETEPNPRDNCP